MTEEPSPRSEPRSGPVRVTIVLLIFAGIVAAAVWYGQHRRSPLPERARADLIHEWRVSGGNQAMFDIGHSALAVGMFGGPNDRPALRLACQTLQRATGRAQQFRPIPDATAQLNWRESLTLISQAADGCVRAAETGDEKVADSAARLAQDASVRIRNVGARLNWVEQNCRERSSDPWLCGDDPETVALLNGGR